MSQYVDVTVNWKWDRSLFPKEERSCVSTAVPNTYIAL